MKAPFPDSERGFLLTKEKSNVSLVPESYFVSMNSKKPSLKKSNKEQNELKFPVINDTMLEPSLRSMDEINEWIEHDYQLFFDRKTYEKEKKITSVLIPFTLSPD